MKIQTSSVTGVVKDKGGKLLISTEGVEYLYTIPNKRISHVNNMNQGYYSGLNSEDIQTIFIDSKTKFWLGS
jgi:regulatory protein YycI of two-component signal transduction system YycFG